MKVKIMKLTAGDIEEINPEVWAEGGKSGLLNIPPIEVKMQPGTPPIRIKQYPMSLEGKKGLIPIIEQLLKEGILEPCMSPHNTPILAVKKAEGKYRLVQDLREINKRTITKHPVVPNPYNLLSQIPQEHAWFTTIDLKDAFWACPLAEESRDWFAFEWDHPETKRRQQLRWTRLPQGFTESPNLFGQALERLLEQFTPEGQVQILQYVDDLLISGENQLEVRTTSIKLLNFLGEKGLKVSKRKLQFVKPEVTYLGHLIGKGYKKLSPERIAGIIAIPAPKTKRDIRKLLGLFGYCRHWIDEYTQNVRFLYDKLVSPEPIEWTQEDEKQLEKLKNKLSTAPVLSLPDLKKEFDLFVNTEGGVAYGVLAQEWGGCKKPIAFLSKILDPVARGWPACLQAVAATAVLVEESQKLTLNGKIQIHTPHDIKTVLSQKAPGWVTDSRILKYEITLINSENLRLTVSKNLNPAQFLSGEPPPDLEHDCLELMSLQTKVREDLESTPLPYGKRLFTDGSSRVLEGKRVSGYAVVEGSTIEDIQVRETGKLPSSWSAQLCEIYAVKRGLDLLGGDRGTIYTDSKYAFGIVHTFGKIWEERGYLNSKGKDLVHKEMIRSVLTSLLKPIEIAVVHVKGHQKETTFEGKGNQLADKEAKRAAQDPKGSIRILALNETSEEEGGEEKPKYDRTELKAIKDLGMRKGEHGEWLTPDGRKFLNKPLARRILTEIHELTHWGTQGLCDHFLKENFCIGIYSIAKAITQGCTICQKVNQRIARKAIPGGRELALRPFQSIQIDFTEMPQIQGYKHLLVMVDHLTHWIEAFPTKKETAEVVVLECLDFTKCGDSVHDEIASRHLQSECRERRRLALRGLVVLSKDPLMARRICSLSQYLLELLGDADGDVVFLTLRVFTNLLQNKNILVSSSTAPKLAEALLPLFDHDNGHVEVLSLDLFFKVMQLSADEAKKPLEKILSQSLLPLFLHCYDENRRVAKASRETLLRVTDFLKRRNLKQLVKKEQLLTFAKCLNNFWGLVHGIWPRRKRDRRRDGRSLFGPPGQLAKREQPGTSNEEERQRESGWFGTHDEWMCYQLNQYLRTQEDPDVNQLANAACWQKRATSKENIKVCKLKEKEKCERKEEKEEEKKLIKDGTLWTIYPLQFTQKCPKSLKILSQFPY
ncbi:hypothetical protein DUI87_04144 [Hirundo rustica rustica]|uniref:ribonuclease H n=1 Tax=Hirundo rustica rustica TaxID=333673 RepID=A0A3M0KY85_HIRRU|nr:hypothetical protein DUI87_04144 [Hirundo rustica rustica]